MNKYAGKVIYFIILSLIFALVYFLIDSLSETDHFNGLDTKTSNFFDYWYFSFTTFSTVGYGDISPKSGTARVMVVLQQVILLLELSNEFLGLINIKLHSEDIKVIKNNIPIKNPGTGFNESSWMRPPTTTTSTNMRR